MSLLKNLFKRSDDVYPFTVTEFMDGEAEISFIDNHGIVYILDLEWVNGILDVEFGVNGSKNHDTTNVHNQYKIIRTIGHIIKVILRERDIYISGLRFKSSHLRAGKIDLRSCDIRNRFFIRFILTKYPNSIISVRHNNVIEVKLNDG